MQFTFHRQRHESAFTTQRQGSHHLSKKKKKKKKATVIFPHLVGNDSRLWDGFNDSPFNNVKSSLPANELLAALFAQGGEIKTLLGPFTVKDMKHLAAVHTSCQANVMTQRDVLHNE